MYNIDEIKELIQALDNSKLTDLEITGEKGEKLCLKKKTEKASSTPAAAVTLQEVQTAENAVSGAVEEKSEKSDGRTIDCPMVGVFYAASSPDAEPYVSIGSKVKIHDVEFDEDVEYVIVGSTEADPMKNRISDESPVGKALIGAKVGQTVQATVPTGEVLEFKVLKISKG